MARKQTVVAKVIKVKKKRPNVHSKNNISKLKSSKNYKKKYRGQGR